VLGLDRDDVFALGLVELRRTLDGQVLLSVAPDVQMISRESALTSRATSSRASSTAFSAVQPYMWLREAGLPNCSRKNGIILSATRGSTGVVAE